MSEKPILAVLSDPMLQSLLQQQAGAYGYEIATADSTDAVRYGLDRSPALLIIDLQVAGLDWRQAVERAKDDGLPVLAFGRHTDAALLRAADEAGCSRVVPRSTLVEELPSLIDGLLRKETLASRYVCPDGHVTTERRTIQEETIVCTHPRLGDDTDPLIDNADVCGKKAVRSDQQ